MNIGLICAAFLYNQQGGDDMEDFILNALSQFGFPAIVCFYLLTKTTKAIDNNTAAINSLKSQIEKNNK